MPYRASGDTSVRISGDVLRSPSNTAVRNLAQCRDHPVDHRTQALRVSRAVAWAASASRIRSHGMLRLSANFCIPAISSVVTSTKSPP